MITQRVQLSLILPLAIAVVASGLYVIKAKHESRQLFVELEALNRERDRLQVDWGRLQIEQSTWGTHPRIEFLASEQLSLGSPIIDDIIVVVEPSQ